MYGVSYQPDGSKELATFATVEEARAWAEQRQNVVVYEDSARCGLAVLIRKGRTWED